MTVEPIRSAVPYDSNIYLVSGDRPIVVDAGTGLDSGGVIPRIRSVCPEGPASIVLTHCHYDHAGGAADLAEEFGCPVFAGWRDAPHVREPDEYAASSMFGGSMRPVDVHDLSEGDVVDTGDHMFTVLETPGHTEGSICLYDGSSGILISGDTVFSNGYGRTDLPGGSMTAMRGSLLRLSKIDIRELFPGHGSTCDRNVHDNLDWVLRMAGV